jgi:hypothetical protein
MTDSDTTAAIDALAYRIRERDAAIRDGEEFADADVFALEYLTALRGQGWRPTPAKSAALPMHAPAGTADKPRSELISDLRADMEARAAAAKAAKESATEAGAA